MSAAVTADDLHDLRTRVAGRVTGPDDAGYDAARAIWNAMVDRRPAVVVRAAGPGDVAPTVAFARRRGLDLAVRGGGHNVAGNGTVEGGVVLDLADLHRVDVDPGARTVRVEAGATLAHVDAATTPHGLAVPLGVVSGTGVAGLTLGGGVGWLTRAHGLTADAVVAVELVTVDGETVTADADHRPDLFWALRGGGGNFGVVTAFTFRAHPLGPEVLAGNLVYGVDRWRDAWTALRTWTSDLPDEMTTITTTLSPPPVLEAGDEPLLVVGLAWASPDRASGAALVDRLRRLAPPDVDDEVGDVDWRAWQSAFDPVFPQGVRAYWRNTSFDALDDDVVDVLVRRGGEQRWVGTAFDVHHMGGAFGRVPQAATPFPRRSAGFWLNIYGFWSDAADDDERVAFVRGMSDDMAPFASGGRYVNFEGRQPPGHRPVDLRAVYGEAAYSRLVDVKRRYDPENVLRVNTNVPPG
ncbi:FAD-binding oxidoreductase [Cellulomonas carbonis]|uniref:Dehydrogenase n=1 Tax=Cellulomonas carbonis T26 TaxID=947969 RepID=A0A0A0BN76_9CELL|nr:FAD-binding oxidoreductase [Cellulomonas carbonis]KGM09365.1 dehydrogenase [Cellulomonas carbonis T26]GGC16167.1 dehydrogenase [Cellulomonas carbonis]